MPLSFFFSLKKKCISELLFSSSLTQRSDCLWPLHFSLSATFFCIDYKVGASKSSFLDVNFRLTCLQLLCFLLNSPKKTHWNNVVSMNRALYLLYQMAFIVCVVYMGWLMQVGIIHSFPDFNICVINHLPLQSLFTSQPVFKTFTLLTESFGISIFLRDDLFFRKFKQNFLSVFSVASYDLPCF